MASSWIVALSSLLPSHIKWAWHWNKIFFIRFRPSAHCKKLFCCNEIFTSVFVTVSTAFPASLSRFLKVEEFKGGDIPLLTLDYSNVYCQCQYEGSQELLKCWRTTLSRLMLPRGFNLIFLPAVGIDNRKYTGQAMPCFRFCIV